MAVRYRAVATAIWEDPWFSGLDSDGKTLCFYLLTNYRASVSDIYVLPIRSAIFETGYGMDTLSILYRQFEEADRILYADDVVWLTGLAAYRQGPSTSPKIKTLIDSDFSAVPNGSVKAAYAIHYGYPIDTVSIPTCATLPSPSPNSNSKEKGAPLPPKGVAASESQYSGEPEEDKKLPPLLDAWHEITTRFPTPKDRAVSQELMTRDDWDRDIACAALKLCYKLTLERGDRPGGLSYLAPSIIEALESGKMPMAKRNGDNVRKPEPPAPSYPTTEEIEAEDREIAKNRKVERIDWANALPVFLKTTSDAMKKIPAMRAAFREQYADDPAFMAIYSELAAEEGWDA